MELKQPSAAPAAPRSSGPLANWIGNHIAICGNALNRLVQQPFASLMTVLVIAVTLALPASMLLVIKNAESISGGWANALDFSVYLNADQSVDDARALAQIVEQRADVDAVTLVTAEDAMAEFKSASGFGAALDQLTVNPLPHTLVVRPSGANTERSMSLLNEELSNLPETDFVQVDTEWVQRFHAILEMLQRAVAMMAGLLGAAILVIIGNTIRLDIQNRREEIEVTKLIGASNAFVRRPFLYIGFWYGFGGGLLALSLVGAGLYALQQPVNRLAGLYNSPFTILSLSLAESLVIIAIGVSLGLTGSWIAATRHMRRIEPR